MTSDVELRLGSLWKKLSLVTSKPFDTVAYPTLRLLLATDLLQDGQDKQDRLSQKGHPLSGRKLRVLDNACGTGTLSVLLTLLHQHGYLADVASLEIVATDAHDAEMQQCRERVKQEGWDHVRLESWPMHNLKVRDQYFTHVFTGFSMQFSEQEQAILAETHRVLKHDGTIGFSSWKRVGVRCASGLDMALMGPSGHWSHADYVRKMLTRLGFLDVQVSEFEFDAWFKGDLDRILPRWVDYLLPRLLEDDGTEASRETREVVRAIVVQDITGGSMDETSTAIISAAHKPSSKS